jgi:signal transduction histidine kinase/ActR/RegA family two-component response regulator
LIAGKRAMSEVLSVLVVDDDEVDRMAVCRALRRTGLPVEVQEVRDEAAAVELLLTRPYDCAFIDYHLGSGSGLTVLEQVRNSGISTPIVMLTGRGDESLAVELMRAGATDYMPKARLGAESVERSLRNAVRVHQAEKEAARAQEALRFIAGASALLSTTLDYVTTIEQVASLATSYLGHYCAIDIIAEDGTVRRVAASHVEPKRDLIAKELMRRYMFDLDLPMGFPQVLRTSEPELLPEITDEIRVAIAQDNEHLDLMRRLNLTSYLCVPLVNRGRLLGAMTVGISDGERRYDSGDLALAEELARRAAASVDNARLYEEAREAIRMRDAFLSVASHELKTPLTSLYLHVELLKRRLTRNGGMGEREQESLESVAQQVRRLNKMIELLLDLSRIESGQLEIERQPVDLTALTERMVEEVQRTLERHRLEFTAPPGPTMIEGDETRLEQVVQNLVQNAIKYSPEGGTVTVGIERQDSQVRLAVRDEGVGIPAEALPNLFDPFFRAEHESARGIGGMGLGLHIVHHIIRAHEGTIGVDSIPGVGSTFVVELPLPSG